MPGELLLALDLGTTSVRALVVDPEGGVRSRARRTLDVRFPAPGRVEQDPEEWVAASGEVLRDALAGARAGAQDVAALGIVTQRATALAWDARDARPLAPALGWQDQRAREMEAELRDRGLGFGAQATLSKLAWWLARDPGVRDAARSGRLRVGTPDAWLARRLSADGGCVTDPGQASCTALYDPARRDWSPELLGRLGLEPRALPRIEPSAAVTGETAPALLGRAVPLAARAGDQQAAAFAQGVHRPGEAKLTLGTAAMLDVHVGEGPRQTVAGAFPLALWRLPDGAEHWCAEGHVATAGAAVEWLVRIGILARAEDLDALAGSVESAEGVVFVPALQGLGTPWADEAARGFAGGLTRGSGRAQLARAVVDGIAQRCADVVEALLPAPQPLRADGGLCRSRVLVQALADATGRPVERARETETTALGAALLAGLGCGALPDLAACRARRAPAARVEPRLAPERRVEARLRWRALLDARVRTRAEAGAPPPAPGSA